MLLSVLLQAAAGVGISKLGAAIGAGIAVLGWKLWHVSRKHQAICV